MPKKIPDRWLDYKPIGRPIKGTRFIAFKVPLSVGINQGVTDKSKRLDISKVLQKISNLGLVIDLTFTTKYYDPKEFLDNGVKYIKLMIPGHGIVPPKEYVDLFNKYVRDFVNDDNNTGKLIGVHCTHGVNRTGFLICNHMITHLKVNPKAALNDFATARGHRIERYNYRDTLLQINRNNKHTKHKEDDRSSEQMRYQPNSFGQKDSNWSSSLGKRRYDNRGGHANPSNRGRNGNAHILFDRQSRETESASQVKGSRRSPMNNNRYPDRNSEWTYYDNNRHSSKPRVTPLNDDDRQRSQSIKAPSQKRRCLDRCNQWRTYDSIADSSQIDPMDQVYSNNEDSSSRFRWQRSLEPANKK